jgi:hypothetical protein
MKDSLLQYEGPIREQVTSSLIGGPWAMGAGPSGLIQTACLCVFQPSNLMQVTVISMGFVLTPQEQYFINPFNATTYMMVRLMHLYPIRRGDEI